MLFVYMFLTLAALKWWGLATVADLSWWWVCSPLVLALIWFEVFEARFGFGSKRMEEDPSDKWRKERVNDQFKNRRR